MRLAVYALIPNLLCYGILLHAYLPPQTHSADSGLFLGRGCCYLCSSLLLLIIIFVAHVAARGSAALGKQSAETHLQSRLVKPRVNLHTPQNVRQLLLPPVRRGCALAAVLRCFSRGTDLQRGYDLGIGAFVKP